MDRTLEEPAPLPQSRRSIELDVLRGVALLGILVMNVQAFSMVHAAYVNPTVGGLPTGADYWVWYAAHLLADGKFISIFSMLFGAGVVLMAERQEHRDLSPGPVHYRRMAWLLLFGLVHAYLIWDGDILVAYAVCGTGVYWLRNLSSKKLLLAGLVFYAVPGALYLALGLSMPFWDAEQIGLLQTSSWRPPPDAIAAEIAAHRGGWLDQLPYRWQGALSVHLVGLPTWLGWRVAGLMLIGMALLKWNILTGGRDSRVYLAMAVTGLSGIPVIAYGVHQNRTHQWSVEYSLFLGSQYNYWASLLVAMAWIGWTILLVRRAPQHLLTRSLAAVGRTALSNYILQSLVCSLIFYGHGWGRFAHFSRSEQMLTVLAIWLAQFAWSMAWLRYFRFGPLEWLWRSLTYHQLQPLRR